MKSMKWSNRNLSQMVHIYNMTRPGAFFKDIKEKMLDKFQRKASFIFHRVTIVENRLFKQTLVYLIMKLMNTISYEI